MGSIIYIRQKCCSIATSVKHFNNRCRERTFEADTYQYCKEKLLRYIAMYTKRRRQARCCLPDGGSVVANDVWGGAVTTRQGCRGSHSVEYCNKHLRDNFDLTLSEKKGLLYPGSSSNQMQNKNKHQVSWIEIYLLFELVAITLFQILIYSFLNLLHTDLDKSCETVSAEIDGSAQTDNPLEPYAGTQNP